MTPLLCDIIVPIWNQPELTRRCLESVLAHTAEPVRLLLVDNGSEIPTRDLLDRFRAEHPGRVEILRNDENLGFIKAVNQGIRSATAPWVCLLNNDTRVTAGWLSEMIRVASEPKIGLVNPTSNSLGFHLGNSSPEEYAAGLRSQTGRWTELTVALGFCLLARHSLFDTIGLLDESYGMGNFDDDDLSRRVRRAGLTCARACASYVYHEEKASFRHLPGWKAEFAENRRRFEAKWGRRLRILWALPGTPPGWERTIGRTALELAKQGHWICFISPEGLPPSIASQAQVSLLPARGRWRPRALWRLVAKRKKPFQVVVTSDPAWARWVKASRWLHGARLFFNPTELEILEQCRTLSLPRSWSAPEEARPLPGTTSLPFPRS